jgi:hypothetical protein
MSEMTAQRALTALAERGVLRETTGRSRNRIWIHDGIVAVLEDYAELARRSHP